MKATKKKFNLLSKIPYLGVPDTPITSSTQKFIPIADITEDLVILKDGGAALVMESTSLNFSLLSEKEQQAVIFAYAALLNSLSFPIQILIRSQVKNISKYMNFLETAYRKITNSKLAALAASHQSFVNETIKKRNVLGKSFYIIIPFSPFEMGVTKSATSLLKKGGKLPFSKSYAVKKAKISLYPKRDHLIRQTKRLGINLRQLTTSQLIELFYNVFNAPPPASKKEE